MSRGQESHPHRAMLEAFEGRVRKLFPEATLTLGKKIKPTGLKPDIYIEHLDGRKWVYEMIYGNASAQHILDNHKQYRNAEIHDFWILWDGLAPGIEPPPPEQGLLEQFISSKKQTKATKLLKALATIHAENTLTGAPVLYAFALDALNGLIANPHQAMQAMLTGITIYQIESIDESYKYLEYTSDFVSLIELDFDENGFIKINDENNDEVLQEKVLRSLGFEDQAKHFPLKFINNLNEMLFNLPGNLPEEATKACLERAFVDAKPQEIIELQDYINSGEITKLGSLIAPLIPPAGQSASLQNAEGIQLIADFGTNLGRSMKNAGIPILFQKLIMLSLAPQLWGDLASVMSWKENSEAVQRLQGDSG